MPEPKTKKKSKDECSEVTADKTVFAQMPESQTKEVKAYILFMSGEHKGKQFLLESTETLIGRAPDSTIVINNKEISRQHFLIRMECGKAVIEDMGSTNGTSVNGQRVTRRILENGDRIQIGSSIVIKFAYGDEGERLFHDEQYQMANFDAATGAYNKHAFENRIDEEVALAKRTKQPLSLLMMDIDFFKKVNDTYGHLAGDMVLFNVAKVASQTIREGDILARYGGEEFVVLLRGVDESGAANLAERIRSQVEKSPTEFEGKKIAVTVSLGTAELGQKIVSSIDLIKAADERLYFSKQNGRNRVSTHAGCEAQK